MTPSAGPRTKLFADALGVFQGGGCRAAAYAGAFRAARERGTHFAEVAGASAGALVAVLVAAGAEPDWLDQRLAELDFRNMLAGPESVSRFVGLTPGRTLKAAMALASGTGTHSTRRLGAWVEDCLQELLPNHSRPVTLFRDLPMPVSVIAADLSTGRAREWSTHRTPAEGVASAVRASCAIPFFFEPESGKFVDGGLLSNLPTYLSSRESRDRLPVLAFSLVDDSAAPGVFRNGVDIARALADTVVRGSQDIQLQLQPHVQVIEIDTGTVKATDFEKMDPETIEGLRKAGYEAVKNFFDDEGVNARPVENVSRYRRSTERWEAIAEQMMLAQRNILVSTRDARWVYELFPALLVALQKRVAVRVRLQQPVGGDRREEYRRALLLALGCVVESSAQMDEAAFECFAFDPELDRSALIALSGSGVYDSAVYRGRDGDEQMIRVLVRSVFGAATDAAPAMVLRGLEAAAPEDVYAVLGQVDQYRSAQFEMAEVELDLVDSWARYALAYKQRQQQEIGRLLREADIPPFSAFWVNLGQLNVRTLAMPPVVERGLQGRYTVVNGLSRLLQLRREGHMTAICAVVSEVGAAPPAQGVVKLSQVGVMIGHRGEPHDRYPGFQHGGVRNVEGPAHTLESLAPVSGSRGPCSAS